MKTRDELRQLASEHVQRVRKAAQTLGLELNESTAAGHSSGYFSGYQDAEQATETKLEHYRSAIIMVGIELGLIMPERVKFFEEEGITKVRALIQEMDDKDREIAQLKAQLQAWRN